MSSSEDVSSDYLPVRVSTLRPGAPITFSAFVHYMDRHLEYKKAGETFDDSLLSLFKSKKIKKVFIRPGDEPLYLEYLDQALGQLAEIEAPIEKRAEFAAAAMSSEAENIERNLDTEEGFNAATGRIEKVIDFITDSKGGLAAMLAAAGVSVDTSQHSATVASLSVSLASRLGLEDKEELTAISLAALIHDNGLKKLEIDPALIYEDIKDSKVKENYRKHAYVSVEMVAGKKYITPRVLRIVADHHEVGEGLGFPDKKWITKLPLSTQIFNLADSFDHFAMSIQKSPKEAIGPFADRFEKHFSLEHIAMLEQAIN